MTGPKTVRSREALWESLPGLLQGPSRTKSSALHDLDFIGPLREWPNFLQDVIANVQGQKWSTRVIKYAQQARDLDAETVLVGDEHGVQGRFQQSVGQVLGKILNAQGINAHFADFKCLNSAYDKIPDVITMSQGNVLKIVGELKVPWIEDHQIKKVFNNERQLRVLLAK
jgi:hypothetical protein